MPDNAECTTTGRKPSASRSRSTPATFFQLVAEDTLVPPNLSTTHGDVPGVAPVAESAVVIENPIRFDIACGRQLSAPRPSCGDHAAERRRQRDRTIHRCLRCCRRSY